MSAMIIIPPKRANSFIKLNYFNPNVLITCIKVLPKPRIKCRFAKFISTC